VNIGAYNLKAIVLRELKRYSKALEYIDKAIELEPNVIFFGIINHLYYPI
jgi:tetratricopeptide (TPR) repeat protein